MAATGRLAAVTSGKRSRRPGMGAVPYPGGTTFRVWAPHADAVFVTGTFDDWAGDRTALERDGDGSTGTWSADVAGVEPGAEYRFTIRTPDGDLSRIDPYARQVTNSVGNGVVYDPAAFDWGDDAFQMPDLGRPRDLRAARRDVRREGRPAGHLRHAPAAGSRTCASSASRPSRSCRRSSSPATSRGATTRPTCSPSSPATAGPTRSSGSSATPTRTGSPSSSTSSTTTSARPTSTCGGSTAGPRATAAASTSTTTSAPMTPWGRHAPDYGRGEVRTFLRDSAMTWLEEFRCDGLRFDATLYIRTRQRRPGRRRVRARRRLVVHGLDQRRDPGAPAVEDHDRRGPPGRSRRSSHRPTRAAPASAPSGTPASSTGAPGRSSPRDDADRDIDERRRGDPRRGPRAAADPGHLHGVARRRGQRPARVPEAIAPGDADSWWAKKRAALGSALVLTSPGIPMLFQGQELLEDRWFDDTDRARLGEGELQPAGSCASTAT